MNILIDALGIVDDMTGVSRYSIRLLENIALIDRENSYTILVQKSLSRDNPVFKINAKNFLFKAIDIPTIGPLRDLYFLFLNYKKYDVFHSLVSNFPVSFLYNRGVVTIHDLKYLKFPQFLGKNWKIKNFYLKRVFDLAVRNCRRVIAVSQSTKNDIIELFNPSARDKITVIYEAADLTCDDIQQANINLNDLYQIKEPYFLFLGENRPHKNIRGLIEAFVIFCKKYNHSFYLVITGKKHPSFYNALENVDSHIKEKIIFTGYIPDKDLPYLYKEAYAFILPSFYEGFGLPILEAMSYGIPVITSRVSSMSEIAGDAALLIDPYCPDDIAEKMNMLVTDKSLYDTLAEKGKERSSIFSWEKAAMETVRVYQAIHNEVADES